MKNITQILGEDYLSKFKVYYPTTLFPPVWEELQRQRCPLCSNKLKFPRNMPVAMCVTPKHKTFVISLKKLDELKLSTR